MAGDNMQARVLARFLASLLLASLACAGDGVAAQRTYVASYGSDAAGCTLTAPCRQFNAAVALTDPDGEVIVLDSAGYGSFTITQSITVAAPKGVYAGISVFAGADGIVVEAPAQRVVLRGLSINAQGVHIKHGIDVRHVGQIVVEDCVVTGLWRGIEFASYAESTLIVRDSVIRFGAVGIDAWRGVMASGDSHVEISRTAVQNATDTGIFLRDVTRASISESFVAGNVIGIQLVATAASPHNPSAAIDRVQVVGNSQGIYAESETTTVVQVVNVANSTLSNQKYESVWASKYSYIRLMGNQIDGNGTGVKVSANAVGVGTLRTNLLSGNVTDYVGATAGMVAPF
jgi:hypothetical protein